MKRIEIKLPKKCNFVPYGEVENLCRTCGYVTWVDLTKTYDEIVSDMIEGEEYYLDFAPNCIRDQIETNKT